MDSIINEEQVESSLPDTSKSFLLNGIDSSIEIYRDSLVYHMLLLSQFMMLFSDKGS